MRLPPSVIALPTILATTFLLSAYFIIAGYFFKRRGILIVRAIALLLLFIAVLMLHQL